MKKITIPLFLAVLILACAWYVGAKTSGTGSPPGNVPGVKPIPGKPITVSNGSLTMNVSANNTNVLEGSNGEMVLQIDLEAVNAAIKGDRKPLNLGLVIDRSGSMSESGKLEYAIIAAQKLVDRLNRNDRLAVVIYDDVVDVLVPSTPVTNPELIKQKIAAVTARNSTNLAQGLILGHNQVAEYFDREAINQVIILSDGLANVGITDPYELKRMVSAWGETGIRVTAMGLGADFNEDLMMGLANASGGRYHFIESPAQLAGIYEKELATLMQTVSKDVKVFINLADGVKLLKVYGYDARVNGSEVEIPVGAFNGGQHRIIVCNLSVPTNKIGTTGVAQVKLDYRDVLQDSKNVTSVAKVNVNCISDVARVEKARNLAVEGNSYWLINSEESNAPISDIQKGKKDEAIRWYEQKIQEIRTRNSTYGNAQLESQADHYSQELDKLKSMPASPADSDDGKIFLKRKKEAQRLESLGYINQ